MTGTSLDALDVALVVVHGRGLGIDAQLAGYQSHVLDQLRPALSALASHDARPPADYVRTARRFGELHARAVDALCRAHLPNGETLAFVAAHGQTICHLSQERLSWQLFDPWPVVQQIGAPVVFDLRQRDLIAGGQGAPITPLADWVMFRDATRSRVVVNLGGICNATVLPSGADVVDVAGGDAGPCNLLLDGLSQRLFNERYDADARRARAGQVHETIIDRISRHITAAIGAATTLGREQFTNHWLDALVRELASEASPTDMLACAVEAVARRIGGHRWLRGADEVILAGGGARNPLLVEAITRHANRASVRSSTALGVPVEAREAMAMAVLGALSHDGVSATLGQITGATAPGVAGTWAGIAIG